ncbi:MAG: C-terminal target protein, partial [Flavipsychrobacter sp.]|nr:C-terminal target protein [Flavipsychrobacter sp.]
MRKLLLSPLNALFAGNDFRAKTTKILFATLLFCAIGFKGFAVVGVTQGTGGTGICPSTATTGGSPSYTSISGIVIGEGVSGDFAVGTTTITLTAPGGWQFNTAAPPSFTTPPGDIASVSSSYSGGNLVFVVTVTGTATTDQITINNLQVEPTSTSASPGYIYASSISPALSGVATGSSGTDFANVSINTPATPTVSIAASPLGIVCSGTNVTFTPTYANAGTSPTFQWLVNGSIVASGPTYSTTTLSNGDNVSTVMSPAGGLTCIFPATVTSNTVTATVSTPPTATLVSGGGTFCGSTTITASGGTGGTIYFQGTTSGGTSTATPSTSQLIATSGTYYFRAQSGGGCWGAEGSVTVVINPIPTAVTVLGGTTTCGGTQTITASNGGSGTIYFQGTTSGGTSTATPSTSQIVSTSGTYYFRAQSGAGCWSAEGSTVVTINTPATANAGSPQSVCAGSAITLAGSIGGGATSSTWSAPTGSFSNTASLTSTYTPSLPNGTETLTLTTNDPDGAGPCPAVNSTVIITINATPTPVSVFPVSGSTFCGSQGISAFGGTGGTMYYQGLTSGGTSTATPSTFQTVTATGTYFFRAQSVSGCWSVEGGSLININPPATVNAGTPQTACSGSTITLAGTIGGSASSATWSAPSGTFSNVNSLGSTYTPSITSGNVTLTLTTNDPDGAGPCGTAVSTVVITVNTAATVNAGFPQTVCSNGFITLAGSIGGGASSSFWTAPSGSFGAPSSTTSTYTPSISSGSETLTLTTNDPDGAGPCPAVFSTVLISVNPAATSNAGTPQTLCAGNTITLNGLMGGSATTAVWSAPSGTFSDVNSPASTYTPTILSGTVTLTLTTNDPDGAGPCTSAASTVLITVNANPTAYTVTGGGAYCAGGAGVPVGLNNSAGGINYQLMRAPSTSVGGSVAGIGTAITFGNQTVAGTYSVIGTNAITSCTTTMTGTVGVTVNPLPTQYAVTGGGQYCAGGAGVAVGLFNSQTGFSYELYIGGVPTGTVVIGTGSGITFGLQTTAGNYTVVATNTLTSCTNIMTGSVNVVVNPLPIAETVSGGGNYCAGGAGLHIFLTPSQVGVNYQLFNGASAVGGLVAGTGAALDFGAQTAAGTYTVVGTDAITGCVNNMTSSATIVIDPLPIIETVTGGGHYCAGGVGLHVGLTPSESAINYDLYDNGVYVTSLTGTGSDLDFGFQTGAGAYSVIATNLTTMCTSNMTSTVTIVIDPLPLVQTISVGGAYCAGGAGVDLTLSGSETGVNYEIYFNGTPTGTIIAGTGSILDLGFQTAAGNYTVVATNATTGCTENMSGTAVVTVNPLPNAYTVSTGGSYCTGGAGIDVTLTPSDNTVGYQLYNNGVPVGGLMTGNGSVLDFGFQTAAGTYTIVGTDLTTFCTNNMSGSSVIVVNPLPTVYNVSGGGAYCAGGAGVPVVLSSSDVGTNYQTFINGVGAGTDAGTGSSITNMQTAAGLYTIVATDGNGCVSNMSGSATVIVNPLPAAIAGPTNVCEGSTITLSDATPGGAWSSSNTSVATIDPVTGLVNGIAAGTTSIAYTLTLTGCQVTSSTTVNPLPVVAPISGAPTVCSGSTTTFTSTTPGGTWSSSSIAIASVDPFGNVTGGIPGTAMITYTVTSPFGCVTSVESAIISLAVPVVAPIVGTVTNICAGLTLSLTEVTTGGMWSSSNNFVASVDMFGVVTGVGFGSAYISYSVTNSNGCTISSTYGVSIGNMMDPSAILPASGSATLCHGNPVNLSVTSTSSTLTYEWSLNGTPIPGATDAAYVATLAGTYTATIGNGTCF